MIRSSHHLLTHLRSQLAAGFRTKARQGRHYQFSHHGGDDDDGEVRRRKHNPDGVAGSEGRFQLHKSRGQHLLTNPRVLDSIVRRAQLRPTDTVLEIGPGTGNLTVRLLDSAAHVVAVEIDDRMVDALQRRVSLAGSHGRLTVITGNVLTAKFPPFDICVANIPYGISSPLIAKLLFELGGGSFRSATLLLQKEFARRLVAEPGDSEFNRLAANVRLVAEVKLLMDVSKKDFVPCPKVDSSLVCIQPRPEIPDVDLDEWLAFTRICFCNKNKTLGAIFKQKKLAMELFSRTGSNGSGCQIYGGEGERDETDNGNSDEDFLGTVGEGGADENALEIGIFKGKMVRILKIGGFEDRRPSKLSSEEFLHLLRLFNQDGILFHLLNSQRKCLDVT